MAEAEVASPELEEQCSGCRYFREAGVQVLRYATLPGQGMRAAPGCLRYPTPIEVVATHWCGEFKRG